MRRGEDERLARALALWWVELCRSWGGDWWDWRQKPLPERAALRAHDWEKNYREGFSKEMGEKYASQSGKAAGQSPAGRVGASLFKRPPEF